MLYLDYSANTPVDEAVLQCFCEAERRYPGNANAHHQAGAAAKAAVDAPMADTINASASANLQTVFFFMVCCSPFLLFGCVSTLSVAYQMRH